MKTHLQAPEHRPVSTAYRQAFAPLQAPWRGDASGDNPEKIRWLGPVDSAGMDELERSGKLGLPRYHPGL